MIKAMCNIFPLLFFYALLAIHPCSAKGMEGFKTGIEVLAREHPEMVRGKNIAMLTSKTAIDMDFNHSIDRIAKAATIKLVFTGDPFFRETIPGANNELSHDVLTNAIVMEITDPLKRPDINIFKGLSMHIMYRHCLRNIFNFQIWLKEKSCRFRQLYL